MSQQPLRGPSASALRRRLAKLTVGDRVVFEPGSGRWPWTVRARDDRFIVATSPWPFMPKGTLAYTVVDVTGWERKHYNGAGPGVVRSSLDILGGGWGDGSYDDSQCAEILDVLITGQFDLSHRRVLSVWDFAVVGQKQEPNS